MDESEVIHFFDYPRRVAKLTGLILTREISRKELIWSAICPTMISLYSILLIFRDWTENEDFEGMLHAVGMVYMLPRIILMRFLRANFADVLYSLEEIRSYGADRRDDLNGVLQKSVISLGRFFFPFGGVSVIGAVITWSYSRSEGQLPFGPIAKWAMDYSFVGCLIFQVVSYIPLGQEYFMTDGVKMCVLQNLATRFRYLNLCFKDVLRYAKEEQSGRDQIGIDTIDCGSVDWKLLQKQLGDAISYHNALIQIAKKVEDIFNKTVLITFISVSLLVCVLLYHMSRLPVTHLDYWKSIFYIFMVYLCFFLDCYLSQQVMDESEDLTNACYEINFVGTNLKFQKALVMIMTRGQKSITFTIGKFAPLSIVAIVIIVKTSVSYYMFLLNMKE